VNHIFIASKDQATAYFQTLADVQRYKSQRGGDVFYGQLKSMGWIPANLEELLAEKKAVVEPVLLPDANGEFPTPVDGALWMAAFGIPQTPLRAGTKSAFLPEWPDHATTDPAQIRAWAAQYPGCNFGSVGLKGGPFVFEVDSSAVSARFAQQGGTFTSKLIVESSPGKGHRYYLSTPGVENIAQTYTRHGDFSVRADREYCVSPGSIHPTTKKQYRIYSHDLSIGLTAPTAQEIAFWQSERVEKKPSSKDDIPRNAQGLVPKGRVHGWMLKQAGKLRGMGLSADAIEVALLEIVHTNCEPPIDKDRVKQMAHSMEKYPAGTPTIELEMNQRPAVLSLLEPTPPAERYAVPSEEVDKRLAEEEYPVIPLVEQAGPTWSDDIMYGIAGDIIRKASEYCEAHPAGMYLDLLVAIGSIIGRGPYFNVNQTQHFTNEFLCRVGLTAESRKGTGRDVIDGVLKLVDPDWYSRRVMSGFGSAEAIVNEVRDPMEQSVRDKKAPTGFQLITVPGVYDKRLCIREGELASVFQLAGKKESRADIVMRDGWDGKALRNIVKGKSRDGLSNSAICREPHLSISGDTTRAELMAKMPDGAADNGFGNRFLYCYVYRTKVCPNGGPELDWSTEIPRLYETIQKAKGLRYVPLTKAASKVWGRMYMELDEPGNRLPGLAGAMTARAAAHIRRLALIYALLDEQDAVDTQHLHAAKRMWDYCQESARYIFLGTTGEQDRIQRYIERNGPVTVSQIVQDLFHKHKTVGWVEAQVIELLNRSRNQRVGIRKDGDKYWFHTK
jgi:hypothetical protein